MALGRQLLLALVAGLLGVAGLSAQNTGTVAGRVTEGGSQEPLPGVTVSLAGGPADVAGRSAVTGADGRFTIGGVPAGTYTARATRIGFGTVARQVTVAAGQTATVDFTVSAQAVLLEEVIAIGYGERAVRDVTGSVQAVSEEDFNTGRVVSPDQLIQGKVAGVQVVNSGEPGGGSSIRIRGGTSVNASNEPLFVVDGVPLAPGGGLSAGRNPLNFINPNDIARMTVLKDASSTAIYGSRGANGVIIIETKTGSDLGPSFHYGNSISTSVITRGPELLGADDFRAAVAQYAPSRVGFLGNANTDWRSLVERDATGQEHELAVQGASEGLNYRLSLNFLDQSGVVQGSDTERISAAINVTQRLFGDRLSLRANLRGARTDDVFTPGAVLGSATVFDPTQPVRTSSGAFFENTQFPLGPNNPLAELALAVDQGRTYRSVGNLEGKYQLPFLEGLSTTVRVGYDIAESERSHFAPTNLQSQIDSCVPNQPCLLGFVDRSNPSETMGVIDAFANYTGRIERLNSDLDATVGYSYESLRGDRPYFYAKGLSTDLLGVNGVPTAQENFTEVKVDENKLASFFGRINYTLADRYLLTLSVRRDGSSRFAPGNQWGTYPGAALAWRISDESFMDRFGWMSDLKLRASWGVNGNQSIPNYSWVPNYRIGDAFSQVQFGNEFVTTIRPTAVDPNIKWEETTSYNLGLDYGFLNDRITGSVEYYLKDTDDLLFRVPVAAGTYVSNTVLTNIGSVRNTGLEMSINADVLDGSRGGLTWSASLNASTNKNRMLTINPFGGGDEQILVNDIAGGVGSRIQVLQPGYANYSFFVFRHKRDGSGNPVYADTDGNGTIDDNDLYEDLTGDGKVTQDDRSVYRAPSPSWIIGHTSQFGWRGADLSFTMRAHLGNYVYNNLASSQGFYDVLNQAGGLVNLHESVLETGFRTAQFFSDVYVEDASFLRMDNLTLGYTIPPRRGFESMRVFGTVQNVFTVTDYSGIDPEAGLYGIDLTIYPRSRTFTAGLSIGF
jgi:TonB-linked SusC/RagA family outer membrane protein